MMHPLLFCPISEREFAIVLEEYIQLFVPQMPQFSLLLKQSTDSHGLKYVPISMSDRGPSHLKKRIQDLFEVKYRNLST